MNTVSLPEPPKTAAQIHEELVKWVESNPKNWHGNPLLMAAAEALKEHHIELRQLKGYPPVIFYEGRAPMGYCPHCKTPVVAREKRVDGNDTCEKGHFYPSSASLRYLKD